MITQIICNVIILMMNLFSGKLGVLSYLSVDELLQMVSVRLSDSL